MTLSFANDAAGNKPLYYVAVTLSSNAGNGFQQQVTVNSNTYNTYLGTAIKNLNIQDGAGNILTSWLESGETNTSTSTIYWVKLPNATITVIYLVFYATTATSKDATVTGAEPTYTATYAQYDNGASIFGYYQSWGGLSALPSGWSAENAPTETFGTTYSTITNNNSAQNQGI